MERNAGAIRALSAALSDIATWLEIVREVEPLFGPMPDFRSTLVRKIAEGSAICVRAGKQDGPVVGGMLLGGTPPDYWIRWLAVRESMRHRGIGRGLVDEALRRFCPPCHVRVDTFCAEFAPGEPARRLYQAAGFRAGERVEISGQARLRFELVRP